VRLSATLISDGGGGERRTGGAAAPGGEASRRWLFRDHRISSQWCRATPPGAIARMRRGVRRCVKMGEPMLRDGGGPR